MEKLDYLIKSKESTSLEMFRTALEKFENNFPQAFQALEIGGVHPINNGPMENPYTHEWDNEDFRNIGEHCVSVGMCANRISDELLKTGVIDEEKYKKITERALIHDANKRFEIFRKKAVKSNGTKGVYDDEAYDTMHSLLQEQGIEGDLLEYIKIAGKETGHGSLVNFVVIDENGKVILNPDVSIEDMVVHLSDDMVASPLKDNKTQEFVTKNTETKFVTVEERTVLGNFKTRYPWLYKEGFGFDGDGKPTLVDNCEQPTSNLTNVKTYAEYQKLVGKLICEFLKEKIGDDSEVDAEYYIKKIVNS